MVIASAYREPIIMREAAYLIAEQIIRQHQLDQRFVVLVSPVFGAVTPLQLTNWLLSSGLQVRFQLQLHKIIWDPAARGV